MDRFEVGIWCWVLEPVLYIQIEEARFTFMAYVFTALQHAQYVVPVRRTCSNEYYA